MLKTAVAPVALLLCANVALAQAAVTVVNPKTLTLGAGTLHVTPRDQNGAAIPIDQCRISNLVASIATAAYDGTGAILTPVAVGTSFNVKWSCTDGINPAVTSAVFNVVVQAPPPPPYAVTQVGDTVP